jgi:hypothetical protein
VCQVAAVRYSVESVWLPDASGVDLTTRHESVELPNERANRNRNINVKHGELGPPSRQCWRKHDALGHIRRWGVEAAGLDQPRAEDDRR